MPGKRRRPSARPAFSTTPCSRRAAAGPGTRAAAGGAVARSGGRTSPARRGGPAGRGRARTRSSAILPVRGSWLWRLRTLPLTIQLGAALALLLATWFVVNIAYHVAHKPTELLFPLEERLYKTPAQTWAVYGNLFERKATATITADFLAALAQVEASGNPLARTYWRWSPSLDPFDIYRPASSAVGLFQFTDATFDEARRYCIRDNRVVEDGPWNDPASCWFNSLYFRVLPGHAVELTSAYLDRTVERLLARHRLRGVGLEKRQQLATLVHLCGAGAGSAFARRGLQLVPGQRCGSHDARAYLDKVARMKEIFRGLAQR